MKVRITYRNEVFIGGDSLSEIKRIWEKIPVTPQGSTFVEISSVENAETLEDIRSEFEEA